MNDDPDDWEDRPFFEVVGFGDLWPNASLQSVSGEQSSEGPYETDMIRRVEEAWRTPFRSLTCGQVRLLLGQKMGLRWLTLPIISFVKLYRNARITNYEGEMAALVLRAARDFDEFGGSEFRAWLKQDFAWLDDVFNWDEQLLRDQKKALATARELIRD